MLIKKTVYNSFIIHSFCYIITSVVHCNFIQRFNVQTGYVYRYVNQTK